MVGIRLKKGDLYAVKEYLEKARAYHHMHRHPENIDHHGDHEKAAARRQLPGPHKSAEIMERA
jgi:hypothetical protein